MKRGIFMTKAEAAAIRAKHLQGIPVKAVELQDAIWTLSKRRDKYHLPRLPKEVRDMVNAVLIFNLGKAIGSKA